MSKKPKKYNKTWTQSDLDYIRDNYKTSDDAEGIARKLGRTKRSVYNQACLIKRYDARNLSDTTSTPVDAINQATDNVNAKIDEMKEWQEYATSAHNRIDEIENYLGFEKTVNFLTGEKCKYMPNRITFKGNGFQRFIARLLGFEV